MFDDDAEKKSKLASDFAAWKKVVKDRKDEKAAKAAAGGGQGRPRGKG